MRTIDFSPLFSSTIGFDRMQRLLDDAHQANVPSYPPYNIEVRGEDAYRITMAVAGFSEQDLDIATKENTLIISGESHTDDEASNYLHHGIAGRSFERRFEIADHIKVTDANLVNGLLHIDLKLELPESKKPRRVAIGSSDKATKAIEKKAA